MFTWKNIYLFWAWLEYHIKYKGFPDVSPPFIATLQWPPLLCSHDFTTFNSKLISFYTSELHENFEYVSHLTYFVYKHITYQFVSPTHAQDIFNIKFWLFNIQKSSREVFKVSPIFEIYIIYVYVSVILYMIYT